MAVKCYAEALQELQEAKKIHGKSVFLSLEIQLLGNAAMSHLKLENIDKCEKYNNLCLNLEPENVKANYRVILIHMVRNQFEEAKKFATECLQKFGDRSFENILTEINKKL